uniref:Uncharacterized protein n=1 Tax=Anopheles minimus TaxID=112268 RepID=A0A182VWL3_9DIPT
MNLGQYPLIARKQVHPSSKLTFSSDASGHVDRGGHRPEVVGKKHNKTSPKGVSLVQLYLQAHVNVWCRRGARTHGSCQAAVVDEKHPTSHFIDCFNHQSTVGFRLGKSIAHDIPDIWFLVATPYCSTLRWKSIVTIPASGRRYKGTLLHRPKPG